MLPPLKINCFFIKILVQQFVRSGYGSDCDSLGMPFILSYDDCMVAIMSLKLVLQTSSLKMPKGCYGSSKGAGFNNAIDGQRHRDFQSICHNNYGNI